MSNDKTILVVEDNDFVRMQIVKFLQSDGYTVIETTSSSQAISAINDNSDSIHCMLVDVRMEPEDGFDFLNKIRLLDVKTPAILVTGDENPDILARASSLGVISVLMKPVNKDRLIKMVDRAIASSRRF
jgi:DNA-binding NtrC family response regulator